MQHLIWLFSLSSILLCSSEEKILPLGKHGNIRYVYEQEKLIRVDRLDSSDQVMYSHSYCYGEDGRLVAECLIGGLGEVIYDGDRIISPVSEEGCEYDENHNLVKHTIDGVVHEYAYDSSNRMITNSSITPCNRDEYGNTIFTENDEYVYDDENNLIKVITPTHVVEYAYDPWGKRISRIVNGRTEYYIYFGMNEIVILDSDELIQELRIPGLSPNGDILRPVAIETKNGIYAPIHDVQGKLMRLIDISSREIIMIDAVDPFGGGLPENAPTSWIFCGHHYDKEAGLVYFGRRYYSPKLKQWLTPDPQKQSEDPYEFCLGNPLSYVDPDGEWAIPLISIAWGAGATITAPVWVPYALAVGAGATVGYWSYKAYEYWQEKKGEPPYNGKELGEDASKRPDKGFEWRGNSNPKSGKGSWYNPKKKESLHPDFNHAGDVKPHWDYKGPGGEEARIYTDGTWEWK